MCRVALNKIRYLIKKAGEALHGKKRKQAIGDRWTVPTQNLTDAEYEKDQITENQEPVQRRLGRPANTIRRKNRQFKPDQ